MKDTFNRSDIDLTPTKPEGINAVHINNERKINVFFDGFDENALPTDEPGMYNRQCECVLFPEDFNEKYWVLFIETKYANDFRNAFKEEYDYPNSMVNQIIETVKYFREKQILEKDKIVSAIVSFPNLIQEFNSTIFQGNLSILDIYLEHKIRIRGTNYAEIMSKRVIKI